MKSKKIVSIITSTVMIGAIGLTTAFATSPGTNADPLVSKSYVDDKIEQIMAAIGNKNTSTTSTTNNTDFASTSYVDTQINQLMTSWDEQMKALKSSGNYSTSGFSEAEKKELVAEIAKQMDLGINQANATDTSSRYVPVNAKYGQVILGGEGCEIILRSGTSVAKVPSVDGLVNATTGGSLKNEDKITKDNIIIIPRNDGRGVKVTSDDAWFIIKGSYVVE